MTSADAALGVRCVGAELPGLAPAAGELPTTRFRLVGAEEFEASWRAEGEAVAIHGTDTVDGQAFMRVWRTGAGSFHLEAAGHGAHLVSADGAACVSYLPDDELRARRFLVAQTLPLASTLHGREVLHAAGAVVAGRLVAVSAASGTGKSTTLAHLLAAGAGFFGDDTLALEPGPELLAHPGPPWLQLQPAVYERLSDSGRARLGAARGALGKLHFHLSPPLAPRPLAAFITLRRDARESRSRVVTETLSAEPLLRAPYIGYVITPERLREQLDIIAHLSANVPCAECVLGADGPEHAVEALVAWVEQNVPVVG